MNYFLIYGGPSSEREISIKTKDFLANLLSDLNPTLVDWQTDFNFKIGSD